MANQEEICPICQYKLTKDRTHILPCGHKHHPRCIDKYYEANCGNYDKYNDCQHIPPECPICRARLEPEHLPFYKGPTLPTPEQLREIILTPSFAAQHPSERPQRLARRARIIHLEERERLLNQLLEQRRRFLTSTQSTSQTSPVILENFSRESTPGLPHFEPPSPPEFRPPSQDDRPMPTYSIPEPPSPTSVPRIPRDISRSRSPVSPSCSQVLQSDPPILQLDSQESLLEELQDIDMQIGIIRNQLKLLAKSIKNNSEVEIKIEENTQMVESNNDLDPLKVIGRYGTGRGRHTHYIVLWSDESETLHHVSEIKACVPEMFEAYQKENRAKNTRNCRERQRNQMAKLRLNP